MSVIGEISGAVSLASTVATIISESVDFPSECRELAARCKVVQAILESNNFSERDLSGLQELSSRLKKCELYLKSCKERRFVRNPLFEVTFHRRIRKHVTRLDAWVLLTTLSVVVILSQPRITKSCKGRMANQMDDGGVLFAATRVRDLTANEEMTSPRRDSLISGLPQVATTDIVFQSDERPAGTQFRARLATGEAVVLEPLAWKRAETPRLISIYAEIGRVVNIQRFFGVFHAAPSNTYYAVMEDLDGDDKSFVLLKDALSNQLIAKVPLVQRLRLCYEIALAVSYLHSLNIVVKVISEKSFYIKEVDGDFVPILTNLEYARLVAPRSR